METRQTRESWNRGKPIGQKPPLKLKDIWAIRIYLQNAHAVRDLALFNVAIDSKLCGCDLVDLRVAARRRSSIGTVRPPIHQMPSEYCRPAGAVRHHKLRGRSYGFNGRSRTHGELQTHSARENRASTQRLHLRRAPDRARNARHPSRVFPLEANPARRRLLLRPVATDRNDPRPRVSWVAPF